MKIKALFLSVLLLALLGPSALHAAKHRRTPVLVLESSNSQGASLLLTVYNDGGSALARKDEDNPQGELCSAQAPAASLQKLQGALRHAGALNLRSQPPTAGFSRKTVSFFIADDDTARTQGNTFVYFVRQDSYLVIETAVLNFISENFGNCI